ncbi:MAG: right-handed parallel beta-helix repeat-containing protein [Candidatus Thorarchaeota archaeon]|nr:right-handed parallel beta-helix repeat-containing protein [Candidatus Thorarchaeota archaeon]
MRLRNQIVTVLLLFFSVNLIQFRQNARENPISLRSNPFTLSEYDDPIVITSNSDFASQGWSGNGSKTNPYLLDGISLFTSFTPAIEIRNTDAYFVLNNSIISSQFSGRLISLSNITNGKISNCDLKYDSKYAWWESGDGIYGGHVSNSSIKDCRLRVVDGLIFENSAHCNLSGNAFVGIANRDGVRIKNSNNMNVSDNLLLYNHYGIRLEDSSYCILTDNVIIGCRYGMGIIRGNALNRPERNVVYNNSFGWITPSVVFDGGSDNQWDDNISLGNAYSDYDGSGSYEIPGEAGSVDRYPRLLDEDVYGPKIVPDIGSWATVTYSWPGPMVFTFTADVTDNSGVDTVLLNLNGTAYEMNRYADSEFFIDFPYQGVYEGLITFTYNFWANDTLGNSQETDSYYGGFGYGVVRPTHSDDDDSTLPFVIIITGFCVCVVVWYVYYQRFRK